jgi:hypothetical protein
VYVNIHKNNTFPSCSFAKINGGGLQHVGLQQAVNLRFIRHLQTYTKILKDPHTLTLVTQISLLLGCLAQKKKYTKKRAKKNNKTANKKYAFSSAALRTASEATLMTDLSLLMSLSLERSWAWYEA